MRKILIALFMLISMNVIDIRINMTDEYHDFVVQPKNQESKDEWMKQQEKFKEDIVEDVE